VSELTELVITQVDELPWKPAEDLGLPGAEYKIYREADDHNGRIQQDVLLRFPAGYTEPRRVNHAEHGGVVVDGVLHYDGNEMVAGDYMFVPSDTFHGPLSWPDGGMMFRSVRAGSLFDYAIADESDKQTSAADVVLVTGATRPWIEAELLGLPEGGMYRVLRHVTDDEGVDQLHLLCNFPPGYIEPLHVHQAEHGDVLIDGEMHTHGYNLMKGDYIFGPSDIHHGPMHYPKGCIVFGSSRGGSILHHYDIG
jgi:hypothetical protein